MTQRAFLFLQGPPGPLFHRLAGAMERNGTIVHRINLSGGDRSNWPGPAVDYTGTASGWPAYVDRFLIEHDITDLLLFGDCRPYHVAAHGIAASRGVRIHVLEEGYLRPDWMTLERNGVNAHSGLARDRDSILAEASSLPREPSFEPITSSFRRRAHDSYWYYHHVLTGRWRFLHYRSHRTSPILTEGFGWLWRLARKERLERQSAEVIEDLMGKPYFLLPLQLSGDYQIRTHSCFADMQTAARFVIESFAANAPHEMNLLLKRHPLDCSFFNWNRFVRREARRLGLGRRLRFIDGGDLEQLTIEARGMVCVNSTSATVALDQGVPVCTLGDAIYAIPGLTYQGHIDDFWRDPKPPEPGLYPAFRKLLVDRCLVRGGLASESAVEILVESMIGRFELESHKEPSQVSTDCRCVGQSGGA